MRTYSRVSNGHYVGISANDAQFLQKLLLYNMPLAGICRFVVLGLLVRGRLY